MKKLLFSMIGLVFTATVMAQDPNILIGFNDAYGIKIKANFPGLTSPWARGYYVTNENNTNNFFGIGVFGQVNNGTSSPLFGWIGKDYNNVFMSFMPNGNVGIGTTNPENFEGWDRVLEVNGINHAKSIVSSSNVKTGIWSHEIGYYGAPAGGITGTYTNHPFSIVTAQSVKMTILPNGDVGIGTIVPKEKLSVNGNIRAKEVKVETANWPDYVFEKEYKMPSLRDLELYISVNKHLPDMPSAKEIQATGIELGEMNRKLLQKIEELTLYVIEQGKEISELKKQIGKKGND